MLVTRLLVAAAGPDQLAGLKALWSAVGRAWFPPLTPRGTRYSRLVIMLLLFSAARMLVNRAAVDGGGLGAGALQCLISGVLATCFVLRAYCTRRSAAHFVTVDRGQTEAAPEPRRTAVVWCSAGVMLPQMLGFAIPGSIITGAGLMKASALSVDHGLGVIWYGWPRQARARHLQKLPLLCFTVLLDLYGHLPHLSAGCSAFGERVWLLRCSSTAGAAL